MTFPFASPDGTNPIVKIREIKDHDDARAGAELVRKNALAGLGQVLLH
jgi:hypothetical protein